MKNLIEYDKKIFANNLRKLMSERNVNASEIGNLLGVSRSTVSYWYNAQKVPRMNKIEMLASYFGVQKSELLEEQYNKEDELDETTKHIIALCSRMSDKQKDKVIAFLELLAESE